MKKCSKCKKVKSISDFNKDSNSKDFYNIWCRECIKKYKRIFYQKTKDKRRKYFREYMKKYLKKKPWINTLTNIQSRCNRKTSRYYKRNIKNFLSTKDLRKLLCSVMEDFASKFLRSSAYSCTT